MAAGRKTRYHGRQKMSNYWQNAGKESVLGELDKLKDAKGYVLVNPDILARAAELLRANDNKH